MSAGVSRGTGGEAAAWRPNRRDRLAARLLDDAGDWPAIVPLVIWLYLVARYA